MASGKTSSGISGALSGATTGATIGEITDFLIAYTNNEVSIIYQIENIVTNRKYIGQTVDLKHRIRKHKKEINNGTHCNKDLLSDYNIYGKQSFIFSCLDICLKEHADAVESIYIEKYKTYNPEFGYNKTFGGATGIHTIETVSKNLGKNNPMYGKTPWNKGKKNAQISWNKGIKTGISHNRRAVIGVNISTNEIKEFISVTEAARYIKTQSTNVSNVCNGKRYKCYKGWKFNYKNEVNCG